MTPGCLEKNRHAWSGTSKPLCGSQTIESTSLQLPILFLSYLLAKKTPPKHASKCNHILYFLHTFAIYYTLSIAPSTVVPIVAHTINGLCPLSICYFNCLSRSSAHILPILSVLTLMREFVPKPAKLTPFFKL